MERRQHKVLVLSSFNVDNLAGLLDNSDSEPFTSTTVGPFGQVLSILEDDGHDIWNQTYDVAVVWTRGEDVIASLRDATRSSHVELSRLQSEVDHYVDGLASAASRVPVILTASWVPPAGRGLGLIDLKADGLARSFAEANSRLVSRTDSLSNVYILDSGRWLRDATTNGESGKGWFLGKIPYTSEIFQSVASDVKAAVRAVAGAPRKVIALDLDGTIWDGIVGEAGWEGLRLGGHDWLGEAFVDFQWMLRSMLNRGVLLAIASKNDEQVALDAIQNHPEMVLRVEDFAAMRINWDDKAQNIVSMAKQLNLSLDAFVFIDDNEVERERVRQALPDVLVPRWPSDPAKFGGFLRSLDCFDSIALTEEDRKRADMYSSERRRQQALTTSSSPDDWLRSLQMIVTVEDPTAANLPRIVQLLNKTNQMNLSTRRLTQSELTDWIDRNGRRLWAVRVADRFGDSGLTGIVSIDVQGDTAHIIDFILSCRVFGRHVERVMAALAIESARQAGCREVSASYRRTERNRPTLEFLRGSGFTGDASSTTFIWPATQEYFVPDFIDVREAYGEFAT